jgi:hypothetical protein
MTRYSFTKGVYRNPSFCAVGFKDTLSILRRVSLMVKGLLPEAPGAQSYSVVQCCGSAVEKRKEVRGWRRKEK